MDLQNLSDQSIISFHLSLLKTYDERTTVFSSLVAALRDAREATGRNIDTGLDPDRFENTNSKKSNWLGTTCYLIILDQLGKCYKRKSDPNLIELSPIQRCLKLHTQLKELEIDAIYALRNAFAHDYSVSNYNRKHPSLRHHFTLLGTYSNPVITLPKNIWDGNPNTKSAENMTYIGIPWIGEIVEKIYRTLVEMHSKNELEVILPGGANEIKNRYLLFSYNR